MKATPPPSPAPSSRGHPLAWLGRQVVRHPWRILAVWIAVLVVCILPAANVGSVITGGFSSPLPSSDESVQAQNAFATEFPRMQGAPTSDIVLLEAPNIVGPDGKNATLAVAASLAQDPRLENVSSIDTLYSTYVGFLVGQAKLGWSFLAPALVSAPSLPQQVNETASVLWLPEATYLDNWEAIVAGQPPSTPASAADWPAFNETRTAFASNASQTEVLSAFYSTPSVGFNASVVGGCLTSLSPTSCADQSSLATLGPVLPSLFPSPSAFELGGIVLNDLRIENRTSWPALQSVAATALGAEVGIAPSWLLTLWQAFPGTSTPSTVALESWANAVVLARPIAAYPLPIPSEIYGSFVNSAGSATLVIVSFNVDDTYMANGSSVTFGDATQISHDVSHTLAATSAYAGIAGYETGNTPLDSATTYLATSALSLLLVLTIIVLLVIMLIYFRAPAAPLLAFGMIGIALVASLAMIFVVGTFVTTFNSEIESIILVFLMSIGTDYSVFLLARYREELVNGADPKDAVETTVRWAGQSIFTSGSAVMVVAVALWFSGISFLTQLGICLLIAVAFALAVNLTVLPMVLVKVGPRIFWPNSGARFQRYANRRTTSIETHRDPIARAGRVATTRPILVVGLILVLSAPVVVVALQVPVSYDITNIGLPASNSAQVGFVHLQNDFGQSYSSTSFALVTFSQPLLPGGVPDAAEFREVEGIATTINGTSGISRVTTLVGSGGAPLSTWLNFSTLPPAARMSLNETFASYVGTGGTTVLFNIETTGNGYSAPAIDVIDSAESRTSAYDSVHPGVEKVLFGGAAPTTQDIRSLVNQASEEMLLGAAIGLFVLMVLILGSAFVPLLALGVIGLSILWSWAGTYFVVGIVENEALIFLLPLILLILVLGLGMDYNVLLLTRVREERVRGNRGVEAIRDAVTHAGGVITAAAVILGGAFLLLGFTSPLGLLAAIGLGIGFAVLLQAFVVQLFFTPAVLTLGKDAIWRGGRRSR